MADLAKEAEERVTLQVGRLIARQVEQTLRLTAVEYGLRVTVERVPTLLTVGMIVTVTGPPRLVDRYIAGVKSWADGHG